MAEYRLYLLDGSGRIMRAVEFVSDDDEAAIEAARAHCAGQAGELWQLGRFVRSLRGE